MNQKGNDFFNTPQYIYDQLNSVFNFTLDAACDSSNIKAPKGYMHDKGECGLTETWENHRVFCNPPFSEKQKWIDKAISEVEKNNCCVVVMVLPLNCMSASAFYDGVIKNGYHFEILKNRISFLDNQTKKPAKGNNSGTVLVYFKKEVTI